MEVHVRVKNEIEVRMRLNVCKILEEVSSMQKFLPHILYQLNMYSRQEEQF